MVGYNTKRFQRMLFLALIFLPLLVASCSRNRDGPKLLTSISSWPLPVKDLFEELVALAPSIKMDGHLISGAPGPHSITTAVFRVHNVNTEVFERLKKTLELVPIGPTHKLAKRSESVVKNTSTEWWAAETQEDVELFVSQHWLDGEEGDLYTVANEPPTGTIYIHYYFNF